MSIVEETHVLRRELAARAAKPEWDFLTRYDLLAKKPRLTLEAILPSVGGSFINANRDTPAEYNEIFVAADPQTCFFRRKCACSSDLRANKSRA